MATSVTNNSQAASNATNGNPNATNHLHNNANANGGTSYDPMGIPLPPHTLGTVRGSWQFWGNPIVYVDVPGVVVPLPRQFVETQVHVFGGRLSAQRKARKRAQIKILAVIIATVLVGVILAATLVTKLGSKRAKGAATGAGGPVTSNATAPIVTSSSEHTSVVSSTSRVLSLAAEYPTGFIGVPSPLVPGTDNTALFPRLGPTHAAQYVIPLPSALGPAPS